MEPTLPDWNTLRLVMPEICLVLGMCAVILTPFINRRNVALHASTGIVALVLALISMFRFEEIQGKLELLITVGTHEPIFHGMLAVDPFSQFFKVLLLLFTLLIVVQWLIVTRDQTHALDVPDFLCLLLGATFGMALMASATNLLMIFVAIESASFPSFALAGFRKRHRVGSEGSLKYVVFGAASSAVMLYGMSLIYGVTGSLNLSEIAAAAAPIVQDDQILWRLNPLLAVGLLAMLAGFAFKLSAVPLHFWCPDVFEGAPIEVTTFLSVASKGAAVCLLLRMLQVFGSAGADAALAIWRELHLHVVPFIGLAIGVAILGGVTATWGNLVAIHQNNIKRLLAYSSIAHAGYMIMASSLIVAAAGDQSASKVVAGALLFYLLVYLFMNLGAFTVAGLVAQRTGSEDIRDYRMFSRRSPVLAVLFTVFLLSLFGMPGLGGFMAKIYLMAAMASAGPFGFVLISVLLINTLISLYYYLRPVYYMLFVEDEQARPNIVPRGAGLAMLLVCAVALLVTGLIPHLVGDVATEYGHLLRTSRMATATVEPLAAAVPLP